MITGAVKNKVDKIWLDIFSAGLANPLTVIEQLTYLMFIRALDVKELENESYESLGMNEGRQNCQTSTNTSRRNYLPSSARYGIMRCGVVFTGDPIRI